MYQPSSHDYSCTCGSDKCIDLFVELTKNEVQDGDLKLGLSIKSFSQSETVPH